MLTIMGTQPTEAAFLEVADDTVAIRLVNESDLGAGSNDLRNVATVRKGSIFRAFRFKIAQAVGVWFILAEDGNWYMLDEGEALVGNRIDVLQTGFTRYVVGLFDVENHTEDDLGLMVITQYPIKVPCYVDDWAVEAGIEIIDRDQEISMAVLKDDLDLLLYLQNSYELYRIMDRLNRPNGVVE